MSGRTDEPPLHLVPTCACDASNTELGYEASLTKTRKIEVVGKAPLVEANMRFRRGRGPLEDLVEDLSEIKGVISVQVTKDEND